MCLCLNIIFNSLFSRLFESKCERLKLNYRIRKITKGKMGE